jgi:hypothetical protein
VHAAQLAGFDWKISGRLFRAFLHTIWFRSQILCYLRTRLFVGHDSRDVLRAFLFFQKNDLGASILLSFSFAACSVGWWLMAGAGLF